MVVSVPMWPPASIPSPITASTPERSSLCARETEFTTGITLIRLPSRSANISQDCPPQWSTLVPVKDDLEHFFRWGERSIRFTPTGLEVISRAFLSRHAASPRVHYQRRSAPILQPPETAAASSAVATQAIPPCRMGYSIPNNSVILVFNFPSSFT